ncbi:MAG: restriction endonuclease subunit S, partial [Clostridium sp.]
MKLIALKDVCKINMGQSPNSSNYNDYGDGMPFFQGNADFGERYPITRVWCNTPTKIAQAEDILISVRAPIGALNYAKEECCIGRGLAAITPDRNKVSQDFIYWALKGKKAELNDKGNGSTFKAISRKILEQTMIPDINFEQQHKCAENLEKIYGIIQNRRKELLALDDLIKARFVEMFGDPVSNPKGWDMVELGELTGIGSSKRIFEKEYVSEGIPFYRTKEIVELSKGNSISTELYITEERFAEIKEQYGVPKAGDLLISAVGTIGIIWIVDGKNDFYFKDGNLIRVDSSDKFDSVYMKNLLENLIVEYKKQMSSGTAYAALTISGLTKMKVYDVPMELQNQFADFVRQVDKSKLMFQKLHQKLNIL